MLQTFHIITSQREQDYPSIAEKVLNKIREQVLCIFLVQDNPD